MKQDSFYTIGVVARMLSIAPQTIRQYEERGLLSPERSAGNTRMYSDADLDQLRTILHLTRDLGINIAGVEMILRMNSRVEQLQKDRESLIRMLYEAGELLNNALKTPGDNAALIKSSLGSLVRFIKID